MFTEPYPRKFHEPSFTDRPLNIVTTTVHSLSTSSAATSWPYAAVETYRDGDKPPLLHPLTLEPHHNLPADVNLDNFKTDVLTSFYRTDVSDVRVFNYDRGLLVLYGGGRLIGRLPRRNEWVTLCGKIFDDIVIFRESDEEDEEVQSDSNDSNTEDEDEQEVMLLDSDSDQEHEERVDSEIQSNANIEGETSLLEDVPPSLLADVSVVEEEVKRTLLRMSGGNEAIENESSRVNITVSAPRACTSSANKRPKIHTATAKFEGFDIRSDLVPILQKIWRNHGNIIENSTMRNADIITRALESLATVVQILENTSVQSLSDSEADYLSSTLSDLNVMGFKVHWLVSFVEKAVKLHKSKTLVDCLNKLTQVSHQVKDRRAMLLDEVTKLNEEEKKLMKEMAKVSKLVPFSGQVKLDEPLGVGLT